MVDRLSQLPESLQLHILSFLDARDAVRTSMLSKSWVSSWTCIPVLKFTSLGFEPLSSFDDFVVNVLSRRQPVKLDKLTFIRHAGVCTPNMSHKVVRYAISHGVEELVALDLPTMVDNSWSEDWNWPSNSLDSLTRLMLDSDDFAVCSFLEPPSLVLFKNLTDLNLGTVTITDPDPFSRFPALDKLTLFSCDVNYKHGAIFNINAPQLSSFTCHHYHKERELPHWELTTPKLRYFEWKGSTLPRLKAHVVLDTAVIYYPGRFDKNPEKIMFDNLLILFNTLSGAKSLTISAPTVHLLTLFPVINTCSPFHVLKCLKLDFTSQHYLSNESELLLGEMLKLVPGVKAYLLQKSHDAKCTIINDPNAWLRSPLGFWIDLQVKLKLWAKDGFIYVMHAIFSYVPSRLRNIYKILMNSKV